MHRQGERRNCTRSDPQRWKQTSTASAATRPALPPTSRPQDWQFIHDRYRPRALDSWAPVILAPHPTLNAGRSPLLPTTTTSGRRGIEAPNASLPRLLQSGLTPKLSGALQRNHWHFIHGASAQTHVRGLLHSLRARSAPQNTASRESAESGYAKNSH